MTLLLLVLGCSQTRWSWPERFAWAGDRTEKELLSGNSVAGRIALIESLSRQASLMSEQEASGQVRAIAHDLKGDTPLPVKLAVVRCLGKLRTPAAVDALEIALHDNAPEVRGEACRCLSHINSPKAMSLLTQALAQEEDVDARIEAVRALGNFRDPLAVQALGSVLDDHDPAVQYLAMQALEKATGKEFGADVRRWKDYTEDPSAILAKQGASATR
jgi:HEAT repeat protein